MSNELNYSITIKVSKEFKGIMGGLWLGMEEQVVVTSDEDAINQFIKRNELLEKAYMAMNPQINWSESYIPKDFSLTERKVDYGKLKEMEEPTKEQAFKDLINSKYQTKKTLEALKPKVEELNNPELSEAFNNKLKSFE